MLAMSSRNLPPISLRSHSHVALPNHEFFLHLHIHEDITLTCVLDWLPQHRLTLANTSHMLMALLQLASQKIVITAQGKKHCQN